MNWWQALILGIVEGITEYLPISSTGHLLVTQRLMGILQSTEADAFALCIQGGAIAAVLGLYRERVLGAFKGIVGKDADGKKLAFNLVAAFVPAVIIVLPLQKIIKKHLFGGNDWGLWPIIGAWLVGGIAILVVNAYREKRKQSDQPRLDLNQLTIKAAALIGVCQCVAAWPGTSRSLATIVGGILVGLSMQAAVEFSFLLGVLTLGAVTAKEGLEHGKLMLDTFGPIPLLIGFLSAWLSAAIAVKWMVGYLNKHGLNIFGYYRIAIAILVGAWVIFGQA